jgi:uncharacterized protein YndB with AHSA1/START domain
MSIRFEHAIEVPASPETAFAMLDDVSQSSRWLARCAGIETLSGGPNAVGTKLRYRYHEGGRVKTMDGEITARAPNERLTYCYTDQIMDVVHDFHLTKTAHGTSVTHAIELTPKTFTTRLLTPLIRRALPKQTVRDLECLRRLLTGDER